MSEPEQTELMSDAYYCSNCENVTHVEQFPETSGFCWYCGHKPKRMTLVEYHRYLQDMEE